MLLAGLAEKIGGSLTLEKEGPGAVFALEIVHDTAGESV